jgi:hypothetical protein
MGFRVTGDKRALRCEYLAAMKEKVMYLLKGGAPDNDAGDEYGGGGGDPVENAIGMMREYGLSREVSVGMCGECGDVSGVWGCVLSVGMRGECGDVW